MAAETRTRRQAPRKPDGDERALARAAELLGKNPLLTKREALRRAGISDARTLRRLAGKLAPPAKKAEAEPPPRKSPQPRQPAAAPLLASAPKRVGTPSKAAPKSATRSAPYQPKTDLPPLRASASPTPASAPDMFAMARPWMALGIRMTTAGLAMQARMAKAALDMPPAATAMRQGAEAFNAWLALFGRRKPEKD